MDLKTKLAALLGFGVGLAGGWHVMAAQPTSAQPLPEKAPPVQIPAHTLGRMATGQIGLPTSIDNVGATTAFMFKSLIHLNRHLPPVAEVGGTDDLMNSAVDVIQHKHKGVGDHAILLADGAEVYFSAPRALPYVAFMCVASPEKILSMTYAALGPDPQTGKPVMWQGTGFNILDKEFNLLSMAKSAPNCTAAMNRIDHMIPEARMSPMVLISKLNQSLSQ